MTEVALLLQSHGFEGFGVVQEVLGKDDATVAEGFECRAAFLALNTALLAANDVAPTDEHSIPKVDDLLKANVRSQRLPQASVERKSGPAAIDALLRPAGVGPDEDVGIHVGIDGVPVSAPERLVPPPHYLQVLLRHRLVLEAHGFEGLL